MLSTIPADQDYFSIGEISRMTGVKPYILRYWESEFGLLRPARRESGHRKFSRRDVEAIHRIRELLYERRFTIEGAKKHLRKETRRGPAQMPLELNDSAAAVQTLKDVKRDLADLLAELKSADFSE